MAIIDIFSFNGELDALEIRLNVLYEWVDEFIICESDETFTGLPKPLYYEENKERYRKFWPKIKHFIMSKENDPGLAYMASQSPGVPQGLHWWRREFIQKESMRYALTHLKDDDLVFIGDADEIWNPNYMPTGRCKLEQTVYSYFLNNKSSEWWEGTSVMPYHWVRSLALDDLRAHDHHVRPISKAPTFPNHGWHFTNMYGTNAEKIKEKLNSYSHQEFNFPQITDNIANQINNNKDFIGRDFTFTVDETGLPQYVLDNRERYAHLFR